MTKKANTEKALSFDEQSQLVRAAFEEQDWNDPDDTGAGDGMDAQPSMDSASCPYMAMHIYPDYLIAMDGPGEYYKVGYSLADGAYQFQPQAEWQRVEKDWVDSTLKAGRTEGGSPSASSREKHAVLTDGRFPIWDKKSALAALRLRGRGTTDEERKKIIAAAKKFA